MSLKKIKFMDTSFRDGFQSVYGARVKTEDFLPAIKASVEAGIEHFEFGGGARFQSLFFYCNESAFDMMDKVRKTVGPKVKLQTLARGINVVGLSQQPKDIIKMHAQLFKKHGTTHIRNFDALNDMENLNYSGNCISGEGLHHQITITLMGLAPGLIDSGVHTAKFYMEKLDEILAKNIPFDSLVFKDASGTCPPKIVFETVKQARQKLGDKATLWFHTHATAGIGTNCIMAAIEAGIDGIDVAQSPVSGGTGQPDILSIWHILKGTDYTLDVDYKKLLQSRKVFEDCMSKYMMPLEAKQTAANIVLSPMPGGALTANTMMMRDTKTLHLFPQVIDEMAEVVAKGGFGTSVTPVSQFYFQQAFVNVTQGRWKKITDGYGNMVLGYFGSTPRPADAEIVALAEKQLKKPPFSGKPLDILSDGVPAAKKMLQENNIKETQENIFIAATCKEKGVAFLKGEAKEAIYYKENDVKSEKSNSSKGEKMAENLIVTVNGKEYSVNVRPSGSAASVKPVVSAPKAAPKAPVKPAAPAKPAPSAPVSSASGNKVASPIAGQIASISVSVGDQVSEDTVVLVLEAMKMENDIFAESAGVIKEILVNKGDTVAEGDPLFVIG